MAVNIVEILVKAKDETKAGFAGAEASSSALGKKLSHIGMGAALGFAAVGYEATKMAMHFDAAMTLLNTQAGVSTDKVAVLKKGVLALAGQVGFSPDSLAESAFHVSSNMASMGATTTQILNAVKVAAQGAAVGHANLVDVTNALTAAIASGIPGVQNYQQAMGMLNATIGSGDMHMQDLAEAFSSGMVATVKGFGLSLKDVGAALAVFGDNNIRGAHAGTQLRMSVMALAAVAPAGVKQLQSMGMSSDQLAKDMRQGGLLKALDDLTTHFHKAGITAKEQGQIITQDFGKKAGAGLNVLMDQMDRLHSKYPAITKGAADFGKAWAATQQTFQQQMNQLKAGFDSLMITIGEKLIPVIQKLISWMSKHKQITTDVVLAVLSLAAVLATYAVVMKTVAVATTLWEVAQVGLRLALGMTRAELNKLSVAEQLQAVGSRIAAAATWLFNAAMDANPVMLVVLAVAALIAILVLVVTHLHETAHIFDLVRHVAAEAFDKVRHAVATAFDWIRAHWPLLLAILTGPIGIAVLMISQHWHQILSGAEHLVGDVTGWFERLPGMILHALGDLGSLLLSAGANIVMGLVHGIESAALAPFHAVSSIVSGIRSLLPFSPAKKGPLSGSGSPDIAGRKFADMFAGGILAGAGGVGSAAYQMAGAARPGLAGGGAGLGGGAGGHITLEIRGSDTNLIHALVLALRKEIRVIGGKGPNSVQIALGQG